MTGVEWRAVLVQCHESCPCTPCYSPPEVTRSPHGLLHHTNGCTSPKTTFPITHCTDVTQLIALITQLIALITLYISLGLPLCHCNNSRVAIARIYAMQILAIATLQSPLRCYSFACFLVFWYLLVYLDSLSTLSCWILYADRRPTLALRLLFALPYTYPFANVWPMLFSDHAS